MAQSDIGIGHVTPNAELVPTTMPYSRSCMLCAAARLGVADALGIEVRSVDNPAEGFHPAAVFPVGNDVRTLDAKSA